MVLSTIHNHLNHYQEATFIHTILQFSVWNLLFVGSIKALFVVCSYLIVVRNGKEFFTSDFRYYYISSEFLIVHLQFPYSMLSNIYFLFMSGDMCSRGKSDPLYIIILGYCQWGCRCTVGFSADSDLEPYQYNSHHSW